MLNILWFSFFMLAFIAGGYQWLWLGHSAIWQELVNNTFVTARSAIDICLGLIGTLCLWLGLLRIAEKAGLIDFFAKLISPLLVRLMPEVPAGHPAMGNLTMNMAANILGLDNAATPIGLRAMEQLQSLNPIKEVASNAQIFFLVINTSSVTLLPITIFLYRAQLGAPDPASVFIPILLATSVSTLVGFLSVAWIQKLPIFDWVVLRYLVAISLLISGIALYFSHLSQAQQTLQSALVGNFLLFAIMIIFVSAGFIKKIGVYDVFIEGAKEGFHVAVKIMPYLVAMLVAIGLLRTSGVLEGLLSIIRYVVNVFGLDPQFVEALPTALMKPLSGSGARAMMIDTMQHYGVDSLPALMAATIQGSTETTFYVLAVYFGSVGIKKVRHAVVCGLLADAAGITAAIMISYAFFGRS